MNLTAILLRSPDALVKPADDRETLARLALPLLTITVVASAVFGLVLGSYRGGLQYLLAAIKLPIFMLAPLLVALPAVWCLHRVLVAPVGHARVVLAALVGIARAAVLAAAAGPFVWLLYSLAIDYHVAILLMAATLCIAGAVGIITMLRLLPSGGSMRWPAHVVALVILGAVSAQSGWLLRPFVVRPRAGIEILRPVEADAFSSMLAAWRSARRDYRGWRAEPAGLLRDRSAGSEER